MSPSSFCATHSLVFCMINKRKRIPQGQSQMGNSQKLATWSKQDEENILSIVWRYVLFFPFIIGIDFASVSTICHIALWNCCDRVVFFVCRFMSIFKYQLIRYLFLGHKFGDCFNIPGSA